MQKTGEIAENYPYGTYDAIYDCQYLGTYPTPDSAEAAIRDAKTADPWSSLIKLTLIRS